MRKRQQIKKAVAVGTVSMLLGVSVFGCGSTSSATSQSANSTASSAEESANVKYGQVTAVSGSKISLSMGTMSEGGPQGGGPSGDTSGGSMQKMPSGDTSGATGGPQGQAPSGDTSGGSVPEMPSGDTSGATGGPQGQAPSGDTSGAADGQAPSGGMGGFTSDGTTKDITISDESIIKVEGSGGTSSQGSLSDIAVDSILKLEYDTDGTTLKSVTVMSSGGGSAPSGGQAPSGDTSGAAQSSDTTSDVTLTGATSVDGTEETYDSQALTSSKADENTLLVTNSGKLTLTNSTLDKTGDTSSEDNSNFSGLNAILCAEDGSSVNISGTTLTSASKGSNAIFATGTDSKVTADNLTISTTQDSSRGLDATYGGTINATNVNITTTGAHCAPLATDRGGGTVTLNKGVLSSSGDGSPCIYSTGDINATNVTGTATGSQSVCVEGKNTVTLKDCDLTGAGANGVMLYQSTSGDATEGTSTLTATDSSLSTTSDGPMFYITNTSSVVNLKNTVLSFTSGVLINCAGNDTNNWGTPGSNGGTLTFNADGEKLTGDVTCDGISSVTISLKNGTTYSGAADSDNAGDCSVSLDGTSSWTLTGDSYVSALTDSDSTCANIISGGHTLYYDSSNEANSWLNGGTLTMSDGGSITPMS